MPSPRLPQPCARQSNDPSVLGDVGREGRGEKRQHSGGGGLGRCRRERPPSRRPGVLGPSVSRVAHRHAPLARPQHASLRCDAHRGGGRSRGGASAPPAPGGRRSPLHASDGPRAQRHRGLRRVLFHPAVRWSPGVRINRSPTVLCGAGVPQVAGAGVGKGHAPLVHEHEPGHRGPRRRGPEARPGLPYHPRQAGGPRRGLRDGAGRQGDLGPLGQGRVRRERAGRGGRLVRDDGQGAGGGRLGGGRGGQAVPRATSALGRDLDGVIPPRVGAVLGAHGTPRAPPDRVGRGVLARASVPHLLTSRDRGAGGGPELCVRRRQAATSRRGHGVRLHDAAHGCVPHLPPPLGRRDTHPDLLRDRSRHRELAGLHDTPRPALRQVLPALAGPVARRGGLGVEAPGPVGGVGEHGLLRQLGGLLRPRGRL
mmetsp:Transcript_22508/g.70620  ORF Transcript_22508/g.70620 Transcript_22508/m.70620 type:complete len:425 (+) Transcript_22508:20-1294(+)